MRMSSENSSPLPSLLSSRKIPMNTKKRKIKLHSKSIERTLLIVSPFIKLDDYFKELFDKHKNNPKIHLILVFGKNENDIKRSMSKSDFDYFNKFLNVSIIYVPNLHAKYYVADFYFTCNQVVQFRKGIDNHLCKCKSVLQQEQMVLTVCY